ncbi:hypothetical protein ZWY2020_006858 [Hordeum vulgare]|nr:hypothetical protein ZWY2020_006858 [Hordeum vulgare]
MLSGTVPFYGATVPEIFEAVPAATCASAARLRRRLAGGQGPDAPHALQGRLRRLSAEQVLRHPWIASCGSDAVAG